MSQMSRAFTSNFARLAQSGRCASALCCLAFVFLSAVPLPTLAQASITNSSPSGDSANPWSVDIVPYLWIAGYDGTFGLPGPPSGVPSVRTESTTDSTAHISAAAMLAAQLRYQDFGLFLDGAWLQLKADGESPTASYSGAEVKTDFAYGTAALSYRLPPLGHLRSDVFAGARIWYASMDIELLPGTSPGFSASSSRTWADPILGASLRYDFTRHWFANVLGDVGGFGAGADIAWNVFGGVGYQFTSWFSASIGYRYLHEDYNQDNFLMNVNVHGFLVGLGFHF
jgi:opacity protein-like surface antigen